MNYLMSYLKDSGLQYLLEDHRTEGDTILRWWAC